MIVMAHRRIRLIGQVVLEEEIEITPATPDDSAKKRRYRRRGKDSKKNDENNNTEDSIKTDTASDTITDDSIKSKPDTEAAAGTEAKESETAEAKEDANTFNPVPVLMIEAENVAPAKPVMTTEVKVSDRTC